MPEASRPAELFELDRPTCLALLTTQHVGRLIIDAATPVIRVVNYTAFEHTIMFRSDPGPQIDAIVDAPVVFEADMFDEHTQSGWTVVVRGIARDLSEHLAGLGTSGATVDPWAPGPKNRWIGIAIDDVTGRLLRGEVRADLGQPAGLPVGRQATVAHPPARCAVPAIGSIAAMPTLPAVLGTSRTDRRPRPAAFAGSAWCDAYAASERSSPHRTATVSHGCLRTPSPGWPADERVRRLPSSAVGRAGREPQPRRAKPSPTWAPPERAHVGSSIRC